MRSAVYECVQQRIESTVQADTVLNWDVIVENQWADQNTRVAKAETSNIQGLEAVHLPPNFSINQGEGVPASPGGEVNELAIALPYCENIEQFALVTEDYPVEVVESVIALLDSAPLRQRLWAWYEAGVLKGTASSPPLPQKPSIGVSKNTSERPPLSAYREGDEVWFYHPFSEQKWLKGVVQSILNHLVRVKGEFFGMLVEKPELIAPGDWEWEAK